MSDEDILRQIGAAVEDWREGSVPAETALRRIAGLVRGAAEERAFDEPYQKPLG